MGKVPPDTLDQTVAFLQKRDGIDKTLKIARYTTKLLLASGFFDADKELRGRLDSFEKSVGTSRKAFRLGKFLQDVNTLRRTPLATMDGLLELVASGGEGVYYFVEQFVWLVKAGAIHKKHGARLQKISAWAELVGYCGSVTLRSLQIMASLEQEARIVASLGAQCESGLLLLSANKAAPAVVATSAPSSQPSTPEEGVRLVSLLRSLRHKRMMKSLALIQDISDAMLAMNDIQDGRGPFKHPTLLAGAGLLSALISAHKNWLSVCS